MTPEDDTDSLRTVFANAFREAQATDACPTPDRLYDAFHRLLPIEERLDIIDHLATCPVCADAWRLAGRTDAPAPTRRRSDLDGASDE
jgi:hypothetical protein